MGTVLNYLWQGALVVLPILFTYFKTTDIANDKWGKVLLPVAETTWNAVEAWKKQQPTGKASPTAALEEFMRRMESMKPLSSGDKEKLSAWANNRSLAAKAK